MTNAPGLGDNRLTPLGLAPDSPLGLWYFQKNPSDVSASVRAGICTFMIDWESAGKHLRQAGRDTEINKDTVEDLAAVSSVPDAFAICRINGPHENSPAEVENAVAMGASLILLPMVRRVTEVESFLRCLDGRTLGGILIETRAAARAAADLAKLPLAAIYIGLNDLAIDLGHRHLFVALADGTVETIARSLSEREVSFGFGGVTVVDGGSPIPCRLLMAELARLGARFSFLRRSFRRDIVGRTMGEEVARIQALWRKLKDRDPATVEADRQSLVAAIATM